MKNNVLVIDKLSKYYPGVKALHEVSFVLKKGEVLALLGENGAGKSTLIKCLTGANTPDSGSITLFGESFQSISPLIARKKGVSAVYQEFNLVPELPIVENVFMGNNPGNGIIVDYKQMLKRCRDFFESFNLNIDPEALVNSLSPAMMQVVEIAKATMLELNILVLDEPTAPLTQKETEILFRIIRALKQNGTSFIYISHRLEEIFEICDRAVILRDGELVGETLIEKTTRQDLIRMMIGRKLSGYYPDHISRSTGEVVFQVENVSGNGTLNSSFELYKGEILGVAGLVGAGRTELMNVLFCNEPKTGGRIFINNVEFFGKQPWHAIEEGIAYLPEDRKTLGLLMDKSLAANLSLSSIKKFSRYGVINKNMEYECIDLYSKKLNIKTPSYEQEVQYLSGGNQQKVIVAKWLATESDIIIFDEPTRGIDVGTKHEIYEIIDQLADEGHSIIMVSSEFEELIGVADRIIVMSEGSIVGGINREEFDKELLLDLASGNR